MLSFTCDPGLQRFLVRIPLCWYVDLTGSIPRLMKGYLVEISLMGLYQ